MTKIGMKNRAVIAAVCFLLISSSAFAAPAAFAAELNSGAFNRLAYNIECEFVRHAAQSTGAASYKYEESKSTAILLENGRLEVFAVGRDIKENVRCRMLATEKNVYVSDFIFADLDGDGFPELIFSLWKRGSFGSCRPSWHAAHEASDDEISSHLYVYSVRRGRVRPLWCSSAVKPAIKSIAKDAVRDYGVDKHVITVERINGDKTSWIWRGWGLELWRDESRL